MISIDNLTCGYENKAIVKNISLDINSGEVLCLLGPNGCGKTTFFKTLLGLLKRIDGKILINGEDIMQWSYAERAKVFGYIPQAHNPPFPFKVLDVVLMGRTAHLKPYEIPSEKDLKIAREAIEIMNISYLEEKIYTEISGGERQLVLIARALTQNPQILIMDEPTSNLDYGNQILVLKHIKELAKLGLAVVLSTHNPEHAFLFATKVIAFNKEKKFNIGKPEEIVTEKILKDMYGVDIGIIIHKKSGMKFCCPYSLITNY